MTTLADDTRALIRLWHSDIERCPVCRLPVYSPSRCERCKLITVHIVQLQAMLAQQGEPVR